MIINMEITGDDNSNIIEVYQGTLQLSVRSVTEFIPIEGATVQMIETNDTDEVIIEVGTDQSGQTDVISLLTPNVKFSLEPEEELPYGEYHVLVKKEGYETVSIEGVQVLADVAALLDVEMTPIKEMINPEEIIIPPHTLYGDYPPKIPEAQVKPVDESGEIVLSRVVIPEYIIVHDGLPTNRLAKNYYVKYRDYIKNVASSEIYATWPEATIYANILAIMSFTLNRVYTEWYRGKGYDFTITSSTAFDQKWVYGRNIFENISYLVDTIFANYLSKPGIKQPIFTSYCDGQRVTCSGLSQWGSKYLGDAGYTAIEILRYYYGSDIYINTADAISGVPSSWPGYILTIGSSGQKVQQAQEQLNRIARNYPAIPVVVADGIYGQMTGEAVKVFQKVFYLPVTGEIDYPTWYEISNIFVGVSRISEPE